MYSGAEGGSVPAFLTKLWTLVEDEATDELISWDASGKSFHVFEQARFSKEILPLFFKHSNIASFIRQLNMYGFRKVVHLEQGGLKTERDDMEFAHQFFVRDQENLLEFIKRKAQAGKVEDLKMKNDDVRRVLCDIRSMRGKQDGMSSKLDSMKRENEALWREVAVLRQKHHKQEQIVNKLIQFLVSMVGNPPRLSMKRKFPLMLPDSSQTQPKMPNVGEPAASELPNGQGVTIQEVMEPSSLSPSTDANVLQLNDGELDVLGTILEPSNTLVDISDIPSKTLDVVDDNSVLGLDSILDAEVELGNIPTIAPPEQTILVDGMAGPSSGVQNVYTMPSNQVALQSPTNRSVRSGKLLSTSPKINEVETHVDGLQADLDVLKDMLSSNQYCLNGNMLDGLFTVEDQFASGGDTKLLPDVNILQDLNNSSSQDSIGKQLVTYEPSLDDYSSLFADPLLGDYDLQPITEAEKSGLNTPEISTSPTNSLLLSSPLASRRKKKAPQKKSKGVSKP